jgi:cobalt-zinc-cadmium efflux system protein
VPVIISVTMFAGIELWVGLISHSLTLRADSGHMLSDGVAVTIALGAAKIAQRSRTNSAQPHRAELLASMANGLGLLAMAGWIGQEAWHHAHGTPDGHLEPTDVDYGEPWPGHQWLQHLLAP